ncbi:hypothetical protein [Streptomyces sp. SAS_260]|uniref:hypothetical protein n=1 Tax=Streptomyces sp. SAS_260 TaxID=3412751 RepID=UPI00403CDD67
MKSATAITKVCGDGQKFIAVAVEYDTEIDTSRLSASSSSSPYVIPGSQAGSTGGPATTPRSRRVRPWPEARLPRGAYLFGAWVTA